MKGNKWFPVGAKECESLVLPARPTFDKIVAAWLILYAKGITSYQLDDFSRIEFRSDQHPNNATWQRWADQLAYVLDVGEQKYQLQDEGSCTALVAKREELGDDPIIATLVRIADQNNQTGYLKGFKPSVVWVLREAYKLGYPKLQVVKAVLDVIQHWCRAQTKAERLTQLYPERTAEALMSEPALKDTLKEATAEEQKPDFRDFTIARYMLDMWRCGRDTDDIVQRAGFFLEICRKFKAAEEKLWDTYLQSNREEFGNGKGVVITTNNDHLGRWVLRNMEYHIVVIRRERSKRQANVVILTRSDMSNRAQALGKPRKLDLRHLAATLILLEGHAQINQRFGRWFYDDRINALLNGSSGHSVPASSLETAMAIELIELLVFQERDHSDEELEELATDLIQQLPEKRQRHINRKRLLRVISRRASHGELKSIYNPKH